MMEKLYRGTVRVTVEYTGGYAYAESEKQAEEIFDEGVYESLYGPIGRYGEFKDMKVEKAEYRIEEVEDFC